MKQRYHSNMDTRDARSLAIWLSVIAVVMPVVDGDDRRQPRAWLAVGRREQVR